MVTIGLATARALLVIAAGNGRIAHGGPNMLKNLFAAFVAAGLLAGQANAGVIAFDQPPGSNSYLMAVSSTLDNFLGTPGYQMADNFALSSAATVTGLNWWGESNQGGNDFTFTFYTDNGGTPGAILLATSGSLMMSTVNTGSGFDPVTFYSSELSTPFSAAAGMTYWLSIFNAAPDASWQWLAADASGDGSFQSQLGSGPTWSSPVQDMAFQVTIPEPATLTLLGVGLLGLGLSCRKRA